MVPVKMFIRKTDFLSLEWRVETLVKLFVDAVSAAHLQESFDP